MIAAALLFLAQITPLPDEPKPIPTSIAAIRANPKKFDGHVVRIHGYVNACRSTCTIDERAASAPEGPGAGISIRPDQKFSDVVRPLIPTYVEFDALFTAGCDPASICLDGAPKLTIVTLRGIVSPEPPPFEKP
jgi:hypothetical protein